MKSTKQLIAAATLTVIGLSAFAQEATPDTWMREARASKSRQEVLAELQAARKDGTINAVSENYDFVRRSPSVKTREEVRAELAQARASGEYAAVNSEAYAFRNGAARPTTLAKGGSRPIPLENSVREVASATLPKPTAQTDPGSTIAAWARFE